MPERKEFFLPLLALLGGWLFTIVYWCIAFIFFFGTLKLFADRFLIPVMKLWARVLLFMCRIRIEHVNPITFPDRKPRVCVCNHQSLLDILWGSSILPPRAMVIGKKEFIYIPIINILWHLMKNVRIDRGDRQKALASLSGVASEIVANSRSLMIAPEGTRTPDGTIFPFKKGAFYIAIEKGVPIYPFVVHGAHQLLPKNHALPQPGTIRMKFLEPVETKGLGIEDLEGLRQKVQDMVLREYNEMNRQYVAYR